jgi:hypothetical protein
MRPALPFCWLVASLCLHEGLALLNSSDALPLHTRAWQQILTTIQDGKHVTCCGQCTVLPTRVAAAESMLGPESTGIPPAGLVPAAYLLQLLQSSNGDIKAAFQAAFSAFAAQGGTTDRHALHMWL